MPPRAVARQLVPHLATPKRDGALSGTLRSAMTGRRVVILLGRMVPRSVMCALDPHWLGDLLLCLGYDFAPIQQNGP